MAETFSVGSAMNNSNCSAHSPSIPFVPLPAGIWCPPTVIFTLHPCHHVPSLHTHTHTHTHTHSVTVTHTAVRLRSRDPPAVSTWLLSHSVSLYDTTGIKTFTHTHGVIQSVYVHRCYKQVYQEVTACKYTNMQLHTRCTFYKIHSCMHSHTAHTHTHTHSSPPVLSTPSPTFSKWSHQISPRLLPITASLLI